MNEAAPGIKIKLAIFDRVEKTTVQNDNGYNNLDI